MKHKTFFALLLAVVIILSSCGVESDDTLDSGTDTTTEAVTTADPYSALRTLDFGGETVTTLIRTEFKYEFGADEETGDVVNDAVFARNRAVEELLNIKLEHRDTAGSFGSRQGFINLYTSSVLADDNSFGMVASAANYMLPLTAERYFKNLMNVENITINAPYYAQGYIENMSMDGKLYLVTGSASINLLENMCVLFFNKDLLEKLGKDDPYEQVISGQWVFDSLAGLVKDAYSDLNGNSEVDDADRFGYLTYNNMINAQLVSMGQKYIERDSNNILTVKQNLSEKDIDIYSAVYDFMNNFDSTYHYNDTSNNALIATENLLKLWNNGNILFMPQVLGTASKLRGSEFDFGILPLPKSDDTQNDYITFVLENVTVIGIPPAADGALSGAVIEAMSIYGYNELSSVYFDVALKEKYSRDEYTKDMLDIIRNSVSFEYPLITQFMAQCIQNQADVVSSYEQVKINASASFKKVVDGWLEVKE